MNDIMPRGRPRKEIDKKDFEGLLEIQCTLEEVVAFFDHKLDGCSVDTIERWCKRTYKKKFAEVSAEKKMLGKINLRRSQLKLAEKNASMGIWLGKVYLGQSETVNFVGQVSDETKAAVKSLIDMNIDMNIDTAETE